MYNDLYKNLYHATNDLLYPEKLKSLTDLSGMMTLSNNSAINSIHSNNSKYFSPPR